MAVYIPSDGDLRKQMEKLVPKVDVDTITTKQFIALLSEKMGGADLSRKKKFIKLNLGTIIDAMEEKKEEEESEDEESSSDEDEAPPPKKKAKKKEGGTKTGGNATGRGGLTEVKEISKTLADFLGRGDRMARTEVVKSLWTYIREHNLQNPNDKREIILDDAMREVFGVDRFTMFQMNKYVGAHIHPFKEVDLTEKPAKIAAKKKREAAAKKKKEEAAKGGKKRKKAGDKEDGGKKRGSSAAFQAPYRLSPELAFVVGTDILPRPQVTKGLWAYIRKHALQSNPEDKRQIVCDKPFRKVMGGEKTVTMFTMNKHITRHLVEKVDPSLYTPPTPPPEETAPAAKKSKPKPKPKPSPVQEAVATVASDDSDDDKSSASSSSSSSSSSDSDSDSDGGGST